MSYREFINNCSNISNNLPEEKYFKDKDVFESIITVLNEICHSNEEWVS